MSDTAQTEQMVLIRIPPGLGEAEIDALRLGAERAALAMLSGVKKGYNGEFRRQGYAVNLDHVASHLDEAFARKVDTESGQPSVYHVAARGLFSASLWDTESPEVTR